MLMPISKTATIDKTLFYGVFSLNLYRSATTSCGMTYLANRAILRFNPHADMERKHKLSA